jgi:hypothetical protein
LEAAGVRGVDGAERLAAYFHAGVDRVSVLRLGAGKEEADFCVGVGDSVPNRFDQRLVTCEDCCDSSVAVVLTLLDTDGANDSSSSSSSCSSLCGQEDEVEVVPTVLEVDDWRMEGMTAPLLPTESVAADRLSQRSVTLLVRGDTTACTGFCTALVQRAATDFFAATTTGTTAASSAGCGFVARCFHRSTTLTLPDGDADLKCVVGAGWRAAVGEAM